MCGYVQETMVQLASLVCSLLIMHLIADAHMYVCSLTRSNSSGLTCVLMSLSVCFRPICLNEILTECIGRNFGGYRGYIPSRPTYLILTCAFVVNMCKNGSYKT